MKYEIIYMAAGNSRRFHSNKLLHELNGKPLYRYGLELLLDFMERHENVGLTVVTQYEAICQDVQNYVDRKKYPDAENDTDRKNHPDAENDTDRKKYPDAENDTDRKNHPDAEKHVLEKRFGCVLNPESRSGASYTIRRGIEEAEKKGGFHYLMFVTADQPWLSRETLEKFLQVGDGGKYSVVSAAWKEEDGKPISETGEGMVPGNPVMFRSDLTDELRALTGDEGGRKVWKRHALEGFFVQVSNPQELKDVDVPEDAKILSDREALWNAKILSDREAPRDVKILSDREAPGDAEIP